ncbi:MAG: hypothetical protein JWO21_1842 [Solirubrobacterales bacterium]|jgi:hypothetical protein|nr:hypothetical protein [Solirubrobacterales bacterium]
MAKSTDPPGPVRPLPSWVPAGWYPDPLKQGAARYWDGNRWSLEHRDDPPPQPVPTSPSEVPASSPPAAAVASGSTREGQPSARDRWRKIPSAARIAIVSGAIIVLLVIIGAATGSGSKKTTTTSAETGVVPTTPSTPAAPPVALKLDTGDYSVTSSHASLHGTVTKGAIVTVEGQHAQVHGTHWSKTVALEIGGNNEAVEATLAGYQPTTQSISVTRHHTQAELEAKAQARRESEQREKEANERRERAERAQKEVEEASPSQQNALKEAESYLHTSAFSEAGLIEQLSSEAGSQFPHQDAVWAVEHLHVNWNDQAVKEAKDYLNTSSFSCQGLIDQLSSDAGSKFTQAQAEYGARQAGIC